MRKSACIGIIACAILFISAGCMNEKKVRDRSGATEMYGRIIELTRDYINRLQSAPDSVDFIALGKEYEDALDKINFSYPPDTDLLLTEGQNDTIQMLLDEYVETRDRRIAAVIHPGVDSDTVIADSLASDSVPFNP